MGRKSVSKERKKLNAKQKRWLANSMNFFYENGIYGPTMNEIAEYLNLSKATIYNYYSSKEDLVHDALWLKLKSLDKFKELLFDDSLDYVQRYLLGVQYATGELAGLSPLYLNDLRTYFPKSWQSILLYNERAAENLIEYYKEGIKRGVFNDFNTKVMSSMDIIIFNSIINPDFLNDNEVSMESAFNSYFMTKFNGILTKRNLGMLTNFQNN